LSFSAYYLQLAVVRQQATRLVLIMMETAGLVGAPVLALQTLKLSRQLKLLYAALVSPFKYFPGVPCLDQQSLVGSVAKRIELRDQCYRLLNQSLWVRRY